MTPKYGRTEAQNWPQGSEKNVLNCITLQMILALYFKIHVALSRLVLIFSFFEEIFLPSSCQPASLLLRQLHLKFLLSHIYFHLDDWELCKQYQSSNQEMMGHTCDFETVEPQEIPIKVCVLFCNALSDQFSYMETVEEKSMYSCIRLIYPNVQLQVC